LSNANTDTLERIEKSEQTKVSTAVEAREGLSVVSVLDAELAGIFEACAKPSTAN
jgi:hypothetical protein